MLSFTGTLLASASRTSSFPPRKVYYKNGGLKQADKDFQSLKPTDVQVINVSNFTHSFSLYYKIVCTLCFMLVVEQVKYSQTSIARTPMAPLPWLIRTSF